jgi:hypothetical protein
MKNSNYLETPQYLRFHMVPVERPAPAENMKPKRLPRAGEPVHPLIAEINEIGRPYEGFCMTIDCETTVFEGQVLRFGIYQIRGIPPERRLELAKLGKLTRADLDTLQEQGIFYAEENLGSPCIERLHRYAAINKMEIMTRVEFSRDVLVGTGRYQQEYWRHGGLIIGFYLAFDFGAIATDFWLAQASFMADLASRCVTAGAPSGSTVPSIPASELSRSHRESIYSSGV